MRLPSAVVVQVLLCAVLSVEALTAGAPDSARRLRLPKSPPTGPPVLLCGTGVLAEEDYVAQWSAWRDVVLRSRKSRDRICEGAALIELARLVGQQDVGNQGEAYLRSGYRLVSEGLGSDHPRVLLLTPRMAFSLYHFVDLAQGLELMRRGVQRLAALVSDDAPLPASICASSVPAGLYPRSVLIGEVRPRDPSRELGAAYRTLARWELAESNSGAAVEALKGALREFEKPGSSRSTRCLSMSTLGIALQEIVRSDPEAPVVLAEWQRLLDLTNGPCEPDVGAGIRLNFANIHLFRGDAEEAQALLKTSREP